MTRSQKQQIKFVRNNAPGYIGDEKVVKEATDQELLAMILMHELYANTYNQAMEHKRHYYNIYESVAVRLK